MSSFDFGLFHKNGYFCQCWKPALSYRVDEYSGAGDSGVESLFSMLTGGWLVDRELLWAARYKLSAAVVALLWFRPSMSVDLVKLSNGFLSIVLLLTSR